MEDDDGRKSGEHNNLATILIIFQKINWAS